MASTKYDNKKNYSKKEEEGKKSKEHYLIHSFTLHEALPLRRERLEKNGIQKKYVCRIKNYEQKKQLFFPVEKKLKKKYFTIFTNWRQATRCDNFNLQCFIVGA